MIRASIALIILLLSMIASAHDARPILFDIVETNQHVTVKQRMPATLPAEILPTLGFSERCSSVSQGRIKVLVDSYERTSHYECQQSLANQQLEFVFNTHRPSLPILIKYQNNTGISISELLKPSVQYWTVPKQQSSWHNAVNYTWLGIEHILMGWDHLIFVVCLLFIIKGVKPCLVTLTGFTVAHSITLIAASLGWLTVSIPAVEAMIALSIVILAMELVKPSDESWTIRYPALVAFMFGLIHGFGFASVLSEIGLPEQQVVLSLLFFNIGVELGQILFVCVLFLFAYMLARLTGGTVSKVKGRLVKPLAYSFGVTGCVWFMQRITLITI